MFLQVEVGDFLGFPGIEFGIYRDWDVFWMFFGYYQGQIGM